MAKILFVSKLFYPHIGGVQKHAYKLGKELVKKGYKVTILTERYDSNLKLKENFEGIDVLRISYRKAKIIGLFNLWFEVLNRIKIFLDSDVIHVHDVFIWILPIRILLFWKPFFLTNHGWEGAYPIPRKNKLLKQISTKLSSGSISIGGYIDKFYGIKSNLISFGGADVPKKFPRKKNKIVYVGRLEKDTGLDLLLKTLRHFPKFNVEFCGDGSMKEECKRYGKVHGFVDPSEYIKDAKVCFCGGYLTILEAFANQCFVVTAYDNPLKKSYLIDTPFSKWIASGSNPKAIAGDLEENIKDKSILKESYNWVKGQTWERLAEKYETLWSLN